MGETATVQSTAFSQRMVGWIGRGVRPLVPEIGDFAIRTSSRCHTHLLRACNTSEGTTTHDGEVQAGKGRLVVASNVIAKPVRAFGGFYSMALDTFVAMFKPPFAWREFIAQSWFVARVSIVPTLLLTIPYTVLLTFITTILLGELGAADFSGTGAALGTVRQIGPIVTVLVVAGAGATAMCADLGARTIREELDALRVMGINPIQALVVPRVLAATIVSLALSATVIIVGLSGAYVFVVYLQNVSPGAFAAGLTTIIGAPDVIIALVKAALFGLSAGLIACYKGISVRGGPAGVGNAVNETVVFTFMALFAINIVATAVAIKITL
ncbi:phospholipid/cholesterol/gamma-HCH transport system permease protein [Mycolicibacterium sp. 624]